MSRWRALGTACACSASIAAVARPPDPWHATAAYFFHPTCQLHAPGVGEPPQGLVLVPYWNASVGWSLWFLTHLQGLKSVRFEAVGTSSSWDVVLEPPRSDFHGGRALLDPAVSDAMLRNLELGHALRMSIARHDEPPLVFEIPTRNQRFAVPMYRACVKSLVDDPPVYLLQPDANFGAEADEAGRCVFRQLIQHGRFPVTVTLLANTEGAEVALDREMETKDPHRSYQRRTNPDRVDARQLFGPAFDLLDTYRYEITREQLEELAGELVRGNRRTLTFTNQAGRISQLQFGGRWGKPTAAMFATCRTLRGS
jgi:hypothetical protein